MTKDIFLALKGLQIETGEDQPQELETISPGQYYKRGDSHYVLYDEVTEGFSAPTKNMIKFRDSLVEVTKKGLINVHLIFEKNKKNMTSYATPYGNIMIGIDTRDVQIREEEQQITVNVWYALEANYQHLSDCRIDLDIRPRQDGIRLI